MSFNVVFLLGGMALGAGGIWLLSDAHHFLETFGADEIIVTYKSDPSSEDLKMLYTQFSYILISMGVFIVVVCLIGLVGAHRGNRVLLVVYSILLFLILTFIVVSTIALVIYQKKVISHVQQFLRNSLIDRYTGNKDHVFTKAWDSLQRSLKCCGVVNFTDFKATKHWKGKGTKIVPESCCSSEDPKLHVSNAKRGCLEEILNLLRKYSSLTIGVIIAISCGLLLLLGLSGHLTLGVYRKLETE